MRERENVRVCIVSRERDLFINTSSPRPRHSASIHFRSISLGLCGIVVLVRFEISFQSAIDSARNATAKSAKRAALASPLQSRFSIGANNNNN